jgi:hypothetical protein
LEPILEQREFLAQEIFPPGEVAKPPATLSLTTPGNQSVQARLISTLPQVNAQIQGISFLYVVPGGTGLAVGMNLVVLVPVGQRLEGTVVPETSIVWEFMELRRPQHRAWNQPSPGCAFMLAFGRIITKRSLVNSYD